MNTKDLLDKYLGKNSRISERDTGNGYKEVCDLDHILNVRFVLFGSGLKCDALHNPLCPFCPGYYSVNVSGTCYTSSIKKVKESP